MNLKHDTNFLGAVRKAYLYYMNYRSYKPPGIRGEQVWNIYSIEDPSAFFANIHHLFNINDNLFILLAAWKRVDEIQTFYETYKINVPVKWRLSNPKWMCDLLNSIFPSAGGNISDFSLFALNFERSYTLPITAEVSKMFSSFYDRYALPEVCDHFIIHDTGNILLENYDAFLDNNVLISTQVSERDISTFASSIHANYKIEDNACV